MVIVRYTEHLQAANTQVVYSPRTFGAGGLIVQPYRSVAGGGTVSVRGFNSGSTQEHHLLSAVFAGSADAGVVFGIPVLHDSITFDTDASATFNALLTWVAEPLVPFGRYPVKSSQANIAASGETSFAPAENQRYAARWVVYATCSTAWSLRMNATLLGQATGLGKVQGFSAGDLFVSRPAIPVPNIIDLRIRNDDGANAGDARVAIWAELGPLGG